MPKRTIALLVMGSSVWLGAACGGDDQGPEPSPLVIEKPASQSGDQQTARVGTALGDPLRVLITRDGEPVEAVDVDWATDQGTLGDEQPSGEDGIASAVWTLGPEEGQQTATARVDGADGSPLTYTATGTAPAPPPQAATVQVQNNFFDPAVITIAAGQTVTWVWDGEDIGLHNVVPDDLKTPDRSGEPDTGPRTFSHTFAQVGAYRYYCEVHGDVNGVGMAGRVIVEARP